MRVTVEKRTRFVPLWNGNQELPEHERLVVHYDNLPWSERRKYQRSTDPKVVIHDVGKKSSAEIDREIDEQTSTVEITVTTDTAGMARAANITLDNLEDQDGKPIDTWAKLLAQPDSAEVGFSKLIAEIEAEVGRSQKERDPKN